MDEHELPKGMHKMPEEFLEDVEGTGNSINHMDCNYSSMVREALSELNKDGIEVKVKKLELMEQENAPSIIALILEVRGVE